MREIQYVFNVSSSSLCAMHGLSSCVKSSVVLALKTEEKTVICALLIIVQRRGCPVITCVELQGICALSMALLPGNGRVAPLMYSLLIGLPLICAEHRGFTELTGFNYKIHEK